MTLGTFELRAGQRIELELRLDALDQDGVVFTHGNHPDSLQLGVDAGRLWFGISGEKEYANGDVVAGRWYRVTIALDDERVALSVDGDEVAATSHWSASPRWKSLPDGALVSYRRQLLRLPAPATDSTPFPLRLRMSARARAPNGRCGWRRTRPSPSGSSARTAMTRSPPPPRPSGAAADFGAALASSEAGYRDLWRSMFTPGNRHFSGHLPTLEAADEGIAKSYYMAALLALYMRNTRISASEPVFLTGGPRLGPTTTYFWDHTEWSRLYALLEPAGMRSWLLRALSSPYDASFGFDTRNGGPLGNHYAANDYSLFRLVEHYVCVTGDRRVPRPAGRIR